MSNRRPAHGPSKGGQKYKTSGGGLVPTKPRSKVVQKANQTRKAGSAGGSRTFGSVGGYGGVNKRMVRQMVNDSVRPEIRGLRNEQGRIDRLTGDSLRDVNSLYDRSVGDLNYTFGEAGDYISKMGQTINSGYDATAAKTAATDATAQTQIAANTSAQQQAIRAELERLGIGGQMGVSDAVGNDAMFAQNQAAQVAGNNQANLAASQQAAGTVTSLLGGMIQGSQASNLGQAVNTRNSGINDVNRASREEGLLITQAMAELRKQKPGMVRDMLLQLQAQGFDQWQAIQALNLDKRSLSHSIAMDRAGMAQDSAYYGTGANAYQTQAGGSKPTTTDWGRPLGPTGQPVIGPVAPSRGGGPRPSRPKKPRGSSTPPRQVGPVRGGI